MISKIFDKAFYIVFFAIFSVLTFIAICAICGTNFL